MTEPVSNTDVETRLAVLAPRFQQRFRRFFTDDAAISRDQEGAAELLERLETAHRMWPLLKNADEIAEFAGIPAGMLVALMPDAPGNPDDLINQLVA
jgi:hypothetical protein